MKRIAFLDRDGTIIKDYEDSKRKEISEPEFLEGSIDAIKNFCNKGFEIIIVTNQYLIGEGFIEQSDYEEFNLRVLDALNISGISILDVFYCPRSRISGCNCCKPKPGLIEAAINKYPEISLSDSFFAGDSITDMELAEHFGIKAFGIELASDGGKFSKVKNLSEVCDFV